MPTGISDGKQCHNSFKHACIVLHMLQFHVASVMANALHFPEIFLAVEANKEVIFIAFDHQLAICDNQDNKKLS